MQQTLHTYITGKYFSAGGRFFGWLTTLLGITMVLNGSITAWALLPVGFLTHFTRRQTEFNLPQKAFREAVSLAGLTFGKWQPLPSFEYLFLKKNNYRRTMESRGSMSVQQLEKFDGYLKLAYNVKLHLVQQKSKEKAMRQMEKIAQDLQVELRDLTEMKYY